MKTPIKATLVSVCIATAFASAAVLAQAPSTQKPQARAAHGSMEHRPFSKPSERVEARLAYQKTALKIADAQLPQWNAYAEHARKTAREMDQRMTEMQQRRSQMQQSGKAAQPGQRSGAIEQLEQRQSMHAQAIRRINEQLAVQKPLYAALSPDQQKVADAVLGHGGRHGMKGMHGQRGRQGMGGQGRQDGRGGHGGHMMRSEGPSVQG